MVQLCNKLGMKLIPWTANEKEDMKALLDLGVHGIISDFPDRLLEVIAAREGHEVLH